MPKIKNSLGRKLKSVSVRDKLSQEKRSILMSKIRSKETKLENKFFQHLKLKKIKFEAHPIGILGHPDLLIKNKNLLIFVDSDFWHGWQYPRWKHKLKNDFWRNKIERNRKRDRFVTRKLRGQGYGVLRIWEHNLKKDKTYDAVIETIFKFK